MELRPYQIDFVLQIRADMRIYKSVCAVLPCGAGKSVIAASIAKSATDKGNRVLFIVHRRELCEQIRETFLSAGVCMKLCDVSMVQKMSRPKRLAKMPKPALIIVDEAHHALAKTYVEILAKADYVLGFTATPTRLKDGGLGEVFKKLVVGVGAKWLIENKYLAPYRMFSVPPCVNLKNVRVRRGEYDHHHLASLLENPQFYADALSAYERHAPGKKAIAYTVSVKSAHELAQSFMLAGYSAAAIDGKTPKNERDAIMQDFRDGKITILCNCELFGEGIDVPDCQCVLLLRKTKSLTLYIQQVMRAMRYQPDKTAVLLDCVENVFEHGLPDANRRWDLERKETENSSGQGYAEIKNCPECFCVMGAAHMECPECGHEFVGKTAVSVEVELEEITELEVLRRLPYDYYKNFETWDELARFCIAKDYRPGWCYYKALELGIELPDDKELRRWYRRGRRRGRETIA